MWLVRCGRVGLGLGAPPGWPGGASLATAEACASALTWMRGHGELARAGV